MSSSPSSAHVRDDHGVRDELRDDEPRRAGRLLLVDSARRVLLFCCSDPARPEEGSWWFTPGGGVEGDESVEDAARREALEETGLAVADLGLAVHRRHASFDFAGVHYEQDDEFFLVRVDRLEVDDRAWTDEERRVLTGHRWWTEEELATTTDTVYPAGLLELLVSVGAFSGDDSAQRP